MEWIEGLEQYGKWIWGISVTLGSVWMLIGRRIRGLVVTFFKTKEAKLSFDEHYEKFQNARMEKLINTIEHYERINNDLDDIATEREILIKEQKKDGETLRKQILEQKILIDQFKKTIDQDKESLEEARVVLRRYRNHIRRLEKLLKENKIHFDEIEL